jgi:hypothetical protein
MKLKPLCLDSLLAQEQQAAINSAKPLSKYLDEALIELNKVDDGRVRYSLSLPESANKLRWFVLPQEIEPQSRIGLAS